jgi:hypothetical protein
MIGMFLSSIKHMAAVDCARTLTGKVQNMSTMVLALPFEGPRPSSLRNAVSFLTFCLNRDFTQKCVITSTSSLPAELSQHSCQAEETKSAPNASNVAPPSTEPDSKPNAGGVQKMADPAIGATPQKESSGGRTEPEQPPKKGSAGLFTPLDHVKQRMWESGLQSAGPFLKDASGKTMTKRAGSSIGPLPLEVRNGQESAAPGAAVKGKSIEFLDVHREKMAELKALEELDFDDGEQARSCEWINVMENKQSLVLKVNRSLGSFWSHRTLIYREEQAPHVLPVAAQSHSGMSSAATSTHTHHWPWFPGSLTCRQKQN